jgi:hypothetical protein
MNIFDITRCPKFTKIESLVDVESPYILRNINAIVTTLLCRYSQSRGSPIKLVHVAQELCLSLSRLQRNPLRLVRDLPFIKCETPDRILSCSNVNEYLWTTAEEHNGVGDSRVDRDYFQILIRVVERRHRAQMRRLEYLELVNDEEEGWEQYVSSPEPELQPQPQPVAAIPEYTPRKRRSSVFPVLNGPDTVDYYAKRLKTSLMDSINMKEIMKDIPTSPEDVKAFDKETNEEMSESFLALSDGLDNATGFTLPRVRSTCPICTENVIVPYALDCGHLLCKDCILNPSYKKMDNGRKVRCPYCREDYTFRKIQCI